MIPRDVVEWLQGQYSLVRSVLGRHASVTTPEIGVRQRSRLRIELAVPHLGQLETRPLHGEQQLVKPIHDVEPFLLGRHVLRSVGCGTGSCR